MSYKIIELEQGTTPWLDYRKSKITATDTAAILNIAYKKTPYQLWQEKLGLREPEPENEAMREGKILEEQCRDFINREMKTDFKPVVLQSSIHEFMMASTDGMNTNGEVLEIKCGRKSYENALNQILETYYYSQLQKIMYVANVDKILYVCYRNNNEYIKNIYFRDDVFIEKMIKAEKAFYKCLMDFTPPALCDRDYEVRNDRAWEILSETWRHKKKELDKVKEEEEALRLELIAQAGGKSTKGAGVILTKYMKRGQINFMSIPEIMSMDKEKLESYRKPNAECYRISSSEDK